ncbi:MAG: peptidylprolyl isomerase [Erythrobacter sp.]|uniref:peptidylprolyl isomerase n=1 Tax=Erythrobacter sp. TaxID=1042 RepID=UPI0032671FAF
MKHARLAAAALIALSTPFWAPLSAQEETEAAPSPNEIVNAAAAKEWVQIEAEDLLLMTLTPDRDGNAREVVIQLMPAPFSQGWVENIRTLARAEWYDGTSVNRVQDNYVVQWGDPGHDNPEGKDIETKPLPEGLNVMGEDEYFEQSQILLVGRPAPQTEASIRERDDRRFQTWRSSDPYAQEPFQGVKFQSGWPIGYDVKGRWPVHCYGMLGVGRNYSPDTGSGAELYTVIGHAPRHLDRNIALVGRIISGMEHLSSLPRGSGVLGFYTQEEADKRTPILRVRVASDLPAGEQPQFEYLATETETFKKYAEARANRRDPFFIVPAGGADICNIPVPIRAVSNAAADE